MNNNGNKQYDGPPSTFVNVKRLKLGEQDSKGREKMSFTFGITKNQEGVEVNSLDTLIDALTELRGKQANITFHVGEAESNGRKFPTAFARVTEMIPKDQQTKTVYVPKTSKTDAAKARNEQIRNSFSKG